jgi:hypothetical protein
MKFLTIAEKIGRPECPYMTRWVLNFGLFSLRLHRWNSGDDDRHYHDHPWDFLVFVLKGWYWNETRLGWETMGAFTVRFRRAEHRHAVLKPDDEPPCWTFLICGPKRRKWGFWIGEKFKKANKYFFENGKHPCG